jgi:hypothetical protein
MVSHYRKEDLSIAICILYAHAFIVQTSASTKCLVLMTGNGARA